MKQWKPLEEIEEIKNFTKKSLSSDYFKDLGVGNEEVSCLDPFKKESREPIYAKERIGIFDLSTLRLRDILRKRTVIPMNEQSDPSKNFLKQVILAEAVYSTCIVDTEIRLYEDGSCFEVIRFGNEKPLSVPLIVENMTLHELRHIYSKTSIENLSRFFWAIGVNREKAPTIEQGYIEPVNVKVGRDMKYKGVFSKLEMTDSYNDLLKSFPKRFNNSTLFHRIGYWWMASVQTAEKESECKNPARIGGYLVDVTPDNQNAFMYFNPNSSVSRGKFLNHRVE